MLKEYAAQRPEALGLDPRFEIDVQGFHTVFRVSPGGQLIVELVAQFVQEDGSGRDDPAFGGVKVLGGSTVIASADGRVRYVVSKPLCEARRSRQREFVGLCDQEDPMLAWGDDDYEPRRLKARTFARLHRAIRR
jgi:hypothetical protein